MPLWYNGIGVKRRLYNLAWFLAALVIVQSLAPMAGLAEVSVRCAGAPASSAPCMRGIIAGAATTAPLTRCADLRCCRSMATLMKTCRMAMEHPAGDTPSPPPALTRLAGPQCLISIKPLSTSQPAIARNAHRWLLHSAPAQAPPCFAAVLPVPTCRASVPLPPSCPLPSRVLVTSHGLRAPPAA